MFLTIWLIIRANDSPIHCEKPRTNLVESPSAPCNDLSHGASCRMHECLDASWSPQTHSAPIWQLEPATCIIRSARSR